MPRTSDVLHSLIFSSEMRHHRSFVLRRRRSLDAGVSRETFDMEKLDPDFRVLSAPVPFVSVSGGSVCLEADDLDRLLWKETRELDVAGPVGGVDGGFK